MCSENVTVGQLYKQIQATQAQSEDDQIASEIKENRLSNQHILRQAAHLIINEVNDNSSDKHYPLDTGISLESSDKFVPENLKYLMKMLITRNATSEIDTTAPSIDSCRRQYLTIAECII